MPYLAIPLLVGCSVSGGGSGQGAGSAQSASAMPEELRSAYIASVQAEARTDAAYRVDPASGTAQNAKQQLAARLDRAGLRVTSADSSQDYHAALSLRSYGCREHAAQVMPAQPRASSNRVEYVRDNLTEWYVNGPLGIEQGFTLATPPRCAGGAGVEVNLEWDTDLTPALAPTQGGERSAMVLRNGLGQVMLAYSDLYAYDATGRRLPAEMRLSGRQVSLRVDDREARYPVTIDPLIWAQQAKLTSSDELTGDTFGASVAISGDTAIVGSPLSDYFLTNQGIAYVFVRTNAQWIQQQRLVASDYSTNDNFGAAVAISGDTVIVGAPNHFGAASSSGQAYVYFRSVGFWGEQAKLTAPGAAASDFFGRSVAIDADTAVVGAPGADLPGQTDAGAAFVFLRTGLSWASQQKLTATDAAASDAFGSAISVSANTALVGAPRRDATGGITDAGAAYVFLRTGTTWAQEAQLIPTDVAATDLFGSAVAISVDTAVIGSPQNDARASNAGAAYVYLRSGASWAAALQKLLASDGALGDLLGTSVAIAGDTLVLGAVSADTILGTDSGAAYVWTRSGATWGETLKLTAADGASSDQFGNSVGIAGDSAIVGCPQHTESFTRRGASYVYLRALSTGDACTSNGQCSSNICINSTCRSGKLQGASCLANGECATNFCVDGVCCDTACGGGEKHCQACSVLAGAAINGTCGVYSSGRLCRAKANECDVAEVCDGISPTCPGDVGLSDGMPCAFGTCQSHMCVGDAPLAYVPPHTADGSHGTGCELVTMQGSSRASTAALLLSLAVLALLLRSRRGVA